MKNILEEIAARTRERIAKEKSCIFVSELENRIQEVNKNADFENDLVNKLIGGRLDDVKKKIEAES